jgi:hypothetical protein
MLQFAAAGFGCSTPTGLAYYRQYGEWPIFAACLRIVARAFLRSATLYCAQRRSMRFRRGCPPIDERRDGGRCGGWLPESNQLHVRLRTLQLYVHGNRMPTGARRRDGSFEAYGDGSMRRPAAVLLNLAVVGIGVRELQGLRPCTCVAGPIQSFYLENKCTLEPSKYANGPPDADPDILRLFLVVRGRAHTCRPVHQRPLSSECWNAPIEFRSGFAILGHAIGGGSSINVRAVRLRTDFATTDRLSHY